MPSKTNIILLVKEKKICKKELRNPRLKFTGLIQLQKPQKEKLKKQKKKSKKQKINLKALLRK